MQKLYVHNRERLTVITSFELKLMLIMTFHYLCDCLLHMAIAVAVTHPSSYNC